MTKTKSRKKSGRKITRGTKVPRAGPSQTTLAYSGPTWDMGAPSNKNMVVVPLLYYTNLTSSVAGVANPVLDQTMGNYGGFSDYVVLYDEYRVLSMQAEFFPVNRYSKTTTSCYPGFGAVDRDSNGPFLSLGAPSTYSSARLMSLEDPWADPRVYKGNVQTPISWKMDGVNDATWITTAAPIASTKPSIKFYFQNLTASTTYGILYSRVLVQFRGSI
jgi:hypothetical protein